MYAVMELQSSSSYVDARTPVNGAYKSTLLAGKIFPASRTIFARSILYLYTSEPPRSQSMDPIRRGNNGSYELENGSEDDNGMTDEEKPSISLGREIVFIAVVCNAQLLTQAGLGVAIAPLHIIGDSFGASDAQLPWFPAAYSLTVGTFILFAGRLGDLFGYRRMFIAGWIWFGLWSLFAGVAVYSGQIFFDICRAIQGLGPALLLPNALAILGRTYPSGGRKDMIFSIFGATAPGGFLLGAVFSSLLAELAWWPWGYWILCIYCFLLSGASFLVIPSDDPIGWPTSKDKFDIWGTTVGVAGLLLLNVAWNQAGVVGWQEPYICVFLVVSVILLALFGYIETKVSHPLLELGKFSTSTLYVLACLAAGWGCFGIWVYYLWQIFEVLRHATPLLACAWYSPIALSGLCAAISTGFLLSRLKPMTIMLIAMMAFFVGTTLVTFMPVEQIYWAQTFVAVIIMPWGMDMSFPSGTILLSNSMPREQQGMAASVVNTVVNYSISISLGIAGTVDSNINRGGSDIMKGYHGALYLGLGLSGSGLLLAIFSILRGMR
ncbi:hypothetical protein E4T39_07022 [Aureobasidium subglaciale]|nr:hypothetical protein E4T39_07022 [Aureobasidium subglaciale]